MKLYVYALLCVLMSGLGYSQSTSIGVTAGFLHVNGKAEIEGNTIKEDRSGAFGGLAVEFTLSETFKFQPEVLYASYKDYGVLMIPIILKYYPIPKFNIQFGPQIDYSTQDYPNDFEPFVTEDDLTRFGFSVAAGLGYDLNERFFLESRYTFQLNDVYTGDLDISVKGHIFNVGLGYRF